jgi:thioredoxin-like negative regulator of GroEL
VRALVAVVVAVGGLATQGRAASIEWSTNLDQASAAARRANKPMLVDFWADWCVPCHVMDATVYSDERVAKAMARVVPVRLDFDRKREIARKYDIPGVPTILLTDSYGTELFRFTGEIAADAMIQLLAETPGDVTEINRLTQMVARDRKDFAALDALGRELRAARFYRSSNAYYERALGTRGSKADAGRRGAIMIAMARNHLEVKEIDRARRLLRSVAGKYPSGPLHDEAVPLLPALGR